jgi:hypothetical protein
LIIYMHQLAKAFLPSKDRTGQRTYQYPQL